MQIPLKLSVSDSRICIKTGNSFSEKGLRSEDDFRTRKSVRKLLITQGLHQKLVTLTPSPVHLNINQFKN